MACKPESRALRQPPRGRRRVDDFATSWRSAERWSFLDRKCSRKVGCKWTGGSNGTSWRKPSVRCAFATSGVGTSVDRGHRSQPYPCPSPQLSPPWSPSPTTSCRFWCRFPHNALGPEGEWPNQSASSPGPGPRSGRCCELSSPVAPRRCEESLSRINQSYKSCGALLVSF